MNIVLESVEFEQIMVGHNGETLNGSTWVNFKCWNEGVTIQGKINVGHRINELILNEIKDDVRKMLSSLDEN